MFKQCVHNLPCSSGSITSMSRYPNFSEVRTIPGRKNIAFVEYSDEGSSSAARDALHNTKLEDLKIKVCADTLALSHLPDHVCALFRSLSRRSRICYRPYVVYSVQFETTCIANSMVSFSVHFCISLPDSPPETIRSVSSASTSRPPRTAKPLKVKTTTQNSWKQTHSLAAVNVPFGDLPMTT